MDSLGEIFSLSLARRKASDDAFWIHPVVHAWASERLNSERRREKTKEAVIVCGQLSMSGNDIRSNKWAFERRILSHLESAQTCLKTHLSPSSMLVSDQMVFQAVEYMG